MLTRALAVLTTDPALAWSWLVADSGYGRDAGLRAFCHRQSVPYVLAVPCDLSLLDVRGAASRTDALLADTPRRRGSNARPAPAARACATTTGPRTR